MAAACSERNPCPSSSSNPRPRPRQSTSISAPTTPSSRPTAMSATCRRRMARSTPTHDFDMIWEVGRRQPQARQGDRRRAEGRRHADPRHRPRPRGRGDQLAPAGGAGRAQGDREGHARQPRRLQRDHQVRRDRGDEEPRARSTRRWSRPTSPAARSTTSSGFNLSPVLWRKLPGREVGGPRAVGLPAPDRRARDGDRGVPRAGILVGHAPSSPRRAARSSRRG